MPKHGYNYKLICSRCGEVFEASKSNAIYCLECRKYPKKFEMKSDEPKSKYFRRCPFCSKNPKLTRFKCEDTIRYRYECSNKDCIASVLPARDFASEKEARLFWNGRA